MATVADGTILRIVASLIFPESVIAQNIFYAVFADTGASNDADDVVSDLGDWIEDIYANMDNQMSSGVDLDSIKVYEYDAGDDDFDEVGDAVLSDTFTGATDMLAHGVAMVMHAKTLNPDVQAAKYIGGLLESNTTDGLFTGSPLTAGAALATEWVTAFVGAATGGDFAPGVWSPTKTNFYLFNGTVVINAIPGYQRRRKPGVGI